MHSFLLFYMEVNMATRKDKVNLNTASFEELTHLRMMGEVRAKNVIDHRPYHDWNEVKEKNASISDRMIDDLKQSGAIID